MAKYKFYWKDGKVEEGSGKTINDTYKNLGHKLFTQKRFFNYWVQNELENLIRYKKSKAVAKNT